MIIEASVVPDLRLNVSGQLRLPSVPVCQQLLLVEEQLLVIYCCVLVVGSFDDGINWAGVLTKSTVNALGHIDIVASSSTGAIRAGLTLNGDGVGWAGSSTQFAGDASESCLRYLSSPVAYLLKACSPLNLGEMAPFS